MALYAAFLVTVGLPLLALGVDVSRVELMRVKLRNATEAACQAYANSLDIQAFQLRNELKFTDGYKNAQNVFFPRFGQFWNVWRGGGKKSWHRCTIGRGKKG